MAAPGYVGHVVERPPIRASETEPQHDGECLVQFDLLASVELGVSISIREHGLPVDNIERSIVPVNSTASRIARFLASSCS